MEITEIKGIGPKRAGELAAIGIHSVEDMANNDNSVVYASELLGVAPDVVQGWVTAAKQLLLDDIPFGENDGVAETAVYEHLLTGAKPVNG